jgi:glutaconate CoA-transferase subunit A
MQTLNKVMSARDVVAQLHDGMTIGIGGWAARRKPMALVRELVRSSLKDLTIVSYGGPDVGLLCASGKIRRLIFGFVTLDNLPLDAHFRNARQGGALQVSEIDEGMLQLGLRAAAMRLPFLPTRAGMGTDVVRRNEWIKTVRSPYSDNELLLAMPAIHLDAALLHVTEADALGNTVIMSPDPFFDEVIGRAARHTYVTCERIVPTPEVCTIERARYQPFERSVVTGVVEAPFGAHPTASAPGYGIDVEHLNEYSAAATADSWAAYRRKYVDVADHDAYVAAVGGYGRIASIAPPVF